MSRKSDSEKQLEDIVSAIEKSYGLIREAIKNNEPTGWYAESEEKDSEEEGTDSDNTT